ncbi:hypothetical protein GL503_25390 [Salmonella enterica]|uniref:Uncharacterized protein n=1 Tax=Salmonella enterica I TaxID=59201 RepID=A0A3R1AIX5_SALET|nr:hypothetical protein [Salmonella enterica subsp. enterica serovar Dahomey]EEB7410370.1 hypothetical protein [Salmonella enterica]MML56780.1 hypothetical protein [Salmonella enterica subsp. enterica serovar Kidderminster]
MRHGDHVDYLHDGHLHHPDGCNPVTGVHDTTHKHGPDCGHEPVPHGDHIDYLVNGRLHHPHGDHCDDHGPVDVLKK